MVLYKRKQVQVVVPKTIPQDLSTEVYVIPQTNEWFLTYDEYLARMDYYNNRKFVCEITGNSCLTFFEALKSEIKEVEDLNRHFPDALKEHVLKFLQFNRITRLDQLVDKVYLHFKNNYFPGEHVLLRGISLGIGVGELSSIKQQGLVREKVEFAGQPTKYLVVRLSDNQEAIATGDKINRDRNHFTKYLIKTFIKLTMARSHKIGAPWVVKRKFSKKYRIAPEYPPDLKPYESTTPVDDDDSDPSLIRHFIRPASTEPKKSQKRGPNAVGRKGKKEDKKDTKSVNKSSVAKNQKKTSIKSILDGNPMQPVVEEPVKIKIRHLPLIYFPDYLKNGEEGVTSDRPGTMASLQNMGISPTKKNIVSDLNIRFDIQNSKPVPQKLSLPDNALEWNKQLLEMIEEKEEEVSKRDLDQKAPSPNSDDESEEEPNSNIDLLSIDKASVGSNHLVRVQEALQSWIFINIYHQPLKIDTFTFDDFIYAMGWSYDQYSDIGRCELLDEIWCSVLGAIVSNKLPSNSEAKEYRDNDEIFGLEVQIPSTHSFITSTKGENDEIVNGSESEAEQNTGALASEVDDEESESESDVKRPKKSNRKDVKQENGDEGDDEGANADTDTDNNGTKGVKKEGSVEVIESESEGASNDESNDESDEETENREHNAFTLMNHRGIPWHERLRKRNFRDGNWQTIVLGVLSLVDHIPKYAPTIEKIYRILAPLDSPASPATALNQFYERMDINLRLQTLNILCDLLASSEMVRDHIDQSLEDSAGLRRRRLDNIKDFKSLLDKAQKLHQAIFESYLDLTNNKDNLEMAKKKPKFDTNQLDMTEEEKPIANINFDFRKMCEERRDLFIKIDELKTEKKSLERQLVELDCQRVRCLGKDRLYNRYWWFENNGLPTLHGSADGDEDNEDDGMDDDELSNDEVSEETYLMGKLWVQGPSEEDIRIHLKCEQLNDYQNDEPYSQIEKTDSDISTLKTFDDKPLQELDYSTLPVGFTKLATESFNLNFTANEIQYRPAPGYQYSPIINKHGMLLDPSVKDVLSPIQRKLIEECPDPLINGSNWRYYDKKEDIEKLVSWLNPYGIRESQLKKELNFVKDAINFSIEARNKAFSNKEGIEKQNKINDQIKQIDEKLSNIVVSVSAEDDDEDEEDEPIEVSSSRKRNLRAQLKSSKRQKRSFDELIVDGDESELIQMKSHLSDQLSDSTEQRELARVMEWVNSLAVEKYDRSLYDGGDKAKARGRR